METVSKFLVPGIILILTLLSGVWLSRSGKPLNNGILTIHKLVALGAVITLVIQTLNALNHAESQFFILLCLIIVSLCVVALVASGAFMSTEQLGYNLMLVLHNVASVGMILSLAIAIILPAGKKP